MHQQSPSTRRLAAPLAAAIVTACALPAMAQVTRSDVRGLIGARGSSGESELASRGYVMWAARAATTASGP